MEITVLNRQDEVGGNKVLVEHKGTRIMLDFGMSFATMNKYYGEFLKPRKGMGLKDYLTMGLLPDVKGIYREDYLAQTGRSSEDKSIDALFLSHAHGDHSYYLHFLRWDIPVYCSKGTRILLEAMQTTSYGDIKDFITVQEQFQFKEYGDGELSRIYRDQEYVHEREFHIVKPHEKITIGPLEIECFPVDHSLPGAYAYIIHSDEGILVYTGDIRFHGYKKESSWEFVERARSLHPRWLLVEGTRIKDRRIDDENWVRQRLTNIISNSKGLVLVEHPIRDMARIFSIYRASKANGRKFIVTMRFALLIELMGELSPISLEDVCIFLPNQGWGLITKEGISDYQKEKDYGYWQRKYLKYENVVTVDDINKNPSSYVLSSSHWMVKHLIDLDTTHAVWIQSKVRAFNIEMKLEEEVKKNWLDRFGVKLDYAHASGHASRKEIKKMIRRIKAKEVIPIHTEYPEEL